MPHVTGPKHKEVRTMDRIKAMIHILTSLNVKVPDERDAQPLSVFHVSESTWAEDAQAKTIETVSPNKTPEFFASKGSDEESPMAVKTECREMLAASGFTERGYDLVAAFEQNLASLGSSDGWDRLDGAGPVDLLSDCGYTPQLIHSMFGFWMAQKWQYQELGQLDAAANCLAMAAYCKTLGDAAGPGRWRRKGEPTAEQLAR
jgi:hypothetical protein